MAERTAYERAFNHGMAIPKKKGELTSIDFPDAIGYCKCMRYNVEMLDDFCKKYPTEEDRLDIDIDWYHNGEYTTHMNEDGYKMYDLSLIHI